MENTLGNTDVIKRPETPESEKPEFQSWLYSYQLWNLEQMTWYR